MRVHILVDNIAGEGLACEWGLSLYIEHAGHVILLDTGASPLFAKNAAAVGCDLAAVEYGVLSHAHYDHADGMDAFFAANDRAKFYLRQGTAENCFDMQGFKRRYIGIRRGTLEKHKDRLVFADGLYELYPGAWLLPHTTPGLGAIGKRAHMYTVNGFLRRRPDDFSHEQSLVLETGAGLVVLSSCSHGGVMNILREVETAFPGKPIRALIGGFHLYETPEAEIDALAEKLKNAGVETVVTGHCTGQAAYDRMKPILGDALTQMHTGMEIAFGETE